jgi:hypothetical protein
MKLNPSSEANSFSATEELPNILWNVKVHYRVHREPATGPNPEPDESSSYTFQTPPTKEKVHQIEVR